MRETLDRWMEWRPTSWPGRGVPLYVMTGNDDPPELHEHAAASLRS